MDGQVLFNIGMTVLGTAGVPLLMFFWNRIKEAKEEGIKQAGLAMAPVLALASESKLIAIDALSRLNQLELRIAKEYVSQQHFERFETRLFQELETIKEKLDNKADKS